MSTVPQTKRLLVPIQLFSLVDRVCLSHGPSPKERVTYPLPVLKESVLYFAVHLGH